MTKVSLKPITRLARVELFVLALGLALAALALAAQGAEPLPPAAASAASAAAAQELAERTRALARAHAAVVGVDVTAVDEAASLATLGREREGSGVVIGADGLVLTIGYLILEADHIDLALPSGQIVPARVVGYDLATGFGLVQALTPLHAEPAPLGDSSAFSGEEPLLIASGGEDGALSLAKMVSRRPYSGYWEYHIDGALFTAPVRVDHSGAALFNANGELLGVGSLIVADALGSSETPLRGNMFVPIDLLKPILDELRERGTSRGSNRAWLGLNCVEHDGHIRVMRVTRSGPADEAGLVPGDRIVAIDGVAVDDLASFYKTLWQRDAEREVTLEIRRDGIAQTLTAHSLDRMKTLRRPQGV
ncbi:MAG: S1C family serine protease [Caldimonas sp.]